MSSRTLHIAFESPEALRREYAGNIANGGIFVATNVDFDVREAVVVEVHIAFVDDVIDLQGEVVHVLSAEVAPAGAEPGVAVQFSERASVIRDRFAPYLGAAVAHEDEEAAGEGARRSRRIATTLDAEIETEEGDALSVETRDLSRGGAAIAVGEKSLHIGETVRLSMRKPTDGSAVEVGARVVRENRNEAGVLESVGVQFDASEAAMVEVGDFVDEVRAEEHAKKLGGITGAIAELGIEHLLQMFCTCSPQGTLTVFRGDAEGFAVFEGGMVRAVRVGETRGRKALARMLEWREGRFEFHANAELEGIDDDPLPLDAALIDAMRLRDECERANVVALPHDARLVVDADAMQRAGSELTKGESAILELAMVGMTVGRIFDVVPEPDTEITVLMSGLVERGLITVG